MASFQRLISTYDGGARTCMRVRTFACSYIEVCVCVCVFLCVCVRGSKIKLPVSVRVGTYCFFICATLTIVDLTTREHTDYITALPELCIIASELRTECYFACF